MIETKSAKLRYSIILYSNAYCTISNYTGRFAVYLSVEHVKINVHQQAIQAYGMWVEKVGKFYLFYILLTLFETIAS